MLQCQALAWYPEGGGSRCTIRLQNSRCQDKAPALIWGLTIPPRPDGSLRHGGSSLCHSAPKRKHASGCTVNSKIRVAPGLRQDRAPPSSTPGGVRGDPPSSSVQYHFRFCLHRRRRLDWSYSFRPKSHRSLPQRGGRPQCPIG